MNQAPHADSGVAESSCSTGVLSINHGSSDDSEFIRLVERIATCTLAQGHFDEMYVVAIKNWFDHKWLKFSGIGRVPFDSSFDSHPQVALDEFWREKITFPPFNPNRVVSQQCHVLGGAGSPALIHSPERKHSSWNLQKRITQRLNSAMLVWYSTETATSGRGSVMVYEVQGETVATWYASFRKDAEWVLNEAKGNTRATVERLMAGI
jgi:hypothetical protein